MDERIRTPDFKKWGLKLRRVIETWRLPLLILALGALILLWPSGKKEAAAAAKPEAAQAEETADTQTRLEQLLSSIEYEMLDAVTYQCLAARMSGCAQKTLRALSQDERRHAKELSAMYFLLTGKKVCPKKPDSPCITCNAETLRRQYQGELAARDRYEALAPLAGARACTLREIALDECRHAQKLYELLQSCL